MGIFDFFSRRRRRESAVQGLSGAHSALGSFAADADPAVVDVQAGAAELGELQGTPGGAETLAALSRLGPMIQQAIATGNVQVQVGQPQTIDMRGSGLGDEIGEIMARHGIDADTGSATETVDASVYGAVREEILAALAKHGVPGAGEADESAP